MSRLIPFSSFCVAAAAIWLGSASTASAQFSESFADFTRVDFFQGPLVSSGRVVGLGGAYTSVAEGADGHLINPASYAVRYQYTANDWFDWDWALSTLRLPAGDQTRLTMSELDSAYQEVGFTQLGLDFKLGRHGFGLHVNSQRYVLEGTLSQTALEYTQDLVSVGYAYAFMDGDLTFGTAIIGGNTEFKGGEGQGIKTSGGGLHFGALWAPCGTRYRLGAAVRSNVVVGKVEEDNTEDPSLLGEKVPNELNIPWELGVGASVMLGQRLYNVCPTYGDEGRIPLQNLARKYFLIATDLVLTGPSKEAVGVESFLLQETERSGEQVSASPRLGIEAEVWPNFMAARLGSYYEPSRFARAGRPHLTGGADINVIEIWWEWKLGFSVDLAEQYANVGVGLGFWH